MEINSLSRTIDWRVIGSLQEKFPGQLPDSAIRGCFKRLPANVCLVGEDQIQGLVLTRGATHFICAGCAGQSMSIDGRHSRQQDDRFLPFYKVINYLQANQFPKPLYLIENTWPGRLGEYPLVDRAAEAVEAFLGAPVVVDAAGGGCHA